MYHRFNENKYPSTNIRMNVFNQQMLIIKELNLNFYEPQIFLNEFNNPKKEKNFNNNR